MYRLLPLVLVFAALVGACFYAPDGRCEVDPDCEEGTICRDGICRVPRSWPDAGPGDAGVP